MGPLALFRLALLRGSGSAGVMLLLLKLSARKYTLLNVPTIGGYYGASPTGLHQPPNPAMKGFEMASLSLTESRGPNQVLAEGSYTDCHTAAQRWAEKHGRLMTFEEWSSRANCIASGTK